MTAPADQLATHDRGVSLTVPKERSTDGAEGVRCRPSGWPRRRPAGDRLPRREHDLSSLRAGNDSAYNRSGVGRESGIAGFEEYLEIKSIAEPA